MIRLTDKMLPPAAVIRKITIPILLMVLLLFMSGTEPLMTALQVSYNRLDIGFSLLALRLSDSGHFPWVALVGFTFLLLLVSRKDYTGRDSVLVAAYVVLISTVFAGGGAWLNENVIKELLKHPRPNIEYLAGENAKGPLGMTAAAFYEDQYGHTRSRAQRSDILQQVLAKKPVEVKLSKAVEKHWIKETGYSFPSGHSFAAMFFASFYLALGLSSLSGWKRNVFYLLLPWALAVCCSRLVLRVHTPLDITIGGLEGLVLGIGAFLLFRFIMNNY